MRLITLLTSLILLAGCVTPKTVDERIQEIKQMDDYSLCYDVAKDVLTSGWAVDELKSRKVNCMNFKSLIIENRRQEISAGLSALALSDALAGRPAQIRNINNYPLPSYFPDYSFKAQLEDFADKLGAINAQQSGRYPTNNPNPPIANKRTVLGFLLTGRTEISGFNKVCYYDALGSIYTLNVGSAEICPITQEF